MTQKTQNPILNGLAPKPLLIVISGPSGVGKDSIVARMHERGYPFHFVVTFNSRPPRPGEIDGIDYHFVSKQQFEELIESQALLEWAHVYGHYRGIAKADVRQALASGYDVITRVNIEGAATIKRIAPSAILIFIAPGSLQELRQRLHQRHTDSPDEIERRLSLATHEMAHVTDFDYVVMNYKDRLDETVADIQAIITAEKHRVFPQHIYL